MFYVHSIALYFCSVKRILQKNAARFHAGGILNIKFYSITTTVFGRIVRVNPPLSAAIVSNGFMSCSSSSV